MIFGKQIDVTVFRIDNTTFESIGQINRYDSLVWPDKFNGHATFEIWAPITKENSELLKKGNIVWCGGDNAARIEIVKSEVDEDGIETINAKGRTLEMLLTTRIIWDTYVASQKNASTVMYDIVRDNCVSPKDSSRKIPFLELANDDKVGNMISAQVSGEEVYEYITKIASESDIGFSILFRPKEKKMIFKVVEGEDRTVEQDVLDPVEFSTDLEDILSSSYYTNDQDLKNVAFVQGEGEGASRRDVVSGEKESTGFDRRELYVDARDIQSEVYNEDGSTQVIPDNEYEEMLIGRGNTKLSEFNVTENFEAQIRVFGGVQYVFGQDYKKGDKVTVRDKKLNVIVSARITEVEEDFDNEYALVLTFGYSYPTIMQKVKSQIK